MTSQSSGRIGYARDAAHWVVVWVLFMGTHTVMRSLESASKCSAARQLKLSADDGVLADLLEEMIDNLCALIGENE